MSYQTQMDTEIILVRESDKNHSLWDLVSDLDRGVLNIPDHQREFVWPDEKILEWVRRLRDQSRLPVGVIVTYQLRNGVPSRIYVNDGSQRLRATRAFLAEPEKYGGCDRERAEEILRSIDMPTQHRHYLSQDQALEDFQLLNVGTTLTPLEFCKGILAYMDNYPVLWKPLFEGIHPIIATSSIVLTGKGGASDRQGRHKHQRHNYSLFVRFSSGRADMYDFKKIAAANIDRASVESKTAVEWMLRSLCERKGVDTIRHDLDAFARFIERETAMIEAVWGGVRSKPGLLLTPTLHRWILDCAIWRRNNDIPITAWEGFLTTLLTRTQGNTTVVEMDSPDVSETLGLSQLGKLKKVCEIIGSDFYGGRVPRKSNSTRKRPGYDNSHMLPFSIHGEGETFVEPASLNRARGAQPVEPIEG